MDAVQAPDAVPAQELGRLDIGRDHAFLDQAMRIVAIDAANTVDLARFVQLERDLRKVEFDSAPGVRALWKTRGTARAIHGPARARSSARLSLAAVQELR